jgi:L-threonylcarbamoyladenylate synthase
MMQTLSFDETLRALLDGDVVAVPTDTVYGVAARLENPAAVQRLFAVKSRPTDVALPVLIGSARDALLLTPWWGDDAQRLADRYWPGALTIIVEAPLPLAQLIGALDTVGLRSPRHEQLAALIGHCGPLVVTSANQHGQAPCVSADDVRATQWAAPVAGVLDAGVCDAPVSTVVQIAPDGWRLRRVGALSSADIGAVLGPETSSRDQ